jgi:hypothetical protein
MQTENYASRSGAQIVEDLKREVEKLRFQMRMVADTLDFHDNPIAYLVIVLNWDDEDLKTANDIFEKYNQRLENEEEVPWKEMEFELKDAFSIGYQTVKTVILAFYHNGQWTNVCRWFAEGQDVSEFKVIRREAALAN